MIQLKCSRKILIYWWLVRITLVVAFGFLPQNLGGSRGPTNDTVAPI